MFRLLALFACIATAQAACDVTVYTACVNTEAGKIAGSSSVCDVYKALAACLNGDCCNDAGKAAVAAYQPAATAAKCGTLACSATAAAPTPPAPTNVGSSQKITFTTFTVAQAQANGNNEAMKCGAVNTYASGACTGMQCKSAAGAAVNGTAGSVNATSGAISASACPTGATVSAVFVTGTSMAADVTASRRAGSAVTFRGLFSSATVTQAALNLFTAAAFKTGFATAMANLPGGWVSALATSDVTSATVSAIKTSGASSVAPAVATMALVGAAALFH